MHGLYWPSLLVDIISPLSTGESLGCSKKARFTLCRKSKGNNFDLSCHDKVDLRFLALNRSDLPFWGEPLAGTILSEKNTNGDLSNMMGPFSTTTDRTGAKPTSLIGKNHIRGPFEGNNKTDFNFPKKPK